MSQQEKRWKKMLGIMRNLKINVAMSCVLGLFAMILASVAGLGLVTSRAADGSIEFIRKINIEQLNNVMQADSNLAGARISLGSAARYVGEEQSMLAERDLEQSLAKLDQAEERFSAFVAASKSEQGAELAARIEESFHAVTDLAREQHQVLVEGYVEDYGFIEAELAPLTGDLTAAITEFVDYAETAATDQMDAYRTEVAFYGSAGVGLMLLAVGILCLIYLGMRMIIIRPLQNAVEDLGRIADADLSSDIQDRGRNEIGQLFLAMRRMQKQLGDIVADVRSGSDSIHNGAREIASGNADLSARTEQQASSLQETATSTEQLTAIVKQNADNAQQASALANEASGTATKGGEVVQEVIVTMRDISDSSLKIADITGLIDSIAFQTNILALNASVEAARAGEQGRGFAVVAGEVRNLAGRSADAAKEIKELIENSVKQVQQGYGLVEQAGSTMEEVVTAVKRVTDIMDEISAASQEQSGGIEQVSQAVSQMDEVTQQNASLVQEAAAAAASLEDQAQHLEKLVSVFKLRNGHGEQRLARSGAQDKQKKAAGGGVTAGRPHPEVPLAARRAKEPTTENDEWEEF